MEKAARIWACTFYIVLLNVNQSVLAYPAEDTQSKDSARPAIAACEKYKRIVSEFDESSEPETAQVLSNYRAKQGEFPYMAAVGYLSTNPENDEIKYACAGTLISEKHVLTTGYCTVNDFGLTPVEVVLGATDLDKVARTARGVQKLAISRVLIHPQYQKKFRYHDIAILELEEPIEFTKYVHPACLIAGPLTSGTEGAENSMVVLGWINLKNDKTSSRKLVKAENQKFVEKTECSETYVPDLASGKSSHIPNGLDDGMICVTKSDSSSEADPCWGSAGAPVLIPSASNRTGLTAAGFSSFGYSCGSDKPSVAVSVYKYLSWIEDEVWPEAEENRSADF